MLQLRRDTVLQRCDKLDTRSKRDLRRASLIDQTHLFPPSLMESAIKSARKTGKDNLIFASAQR